MASVMVYTMRSRSFKRKLRLCCGEDDAPAGRVVDMKTASSDPMIDENDPRIPNTSTVWQLWYSDTFDREAPQSLQASGANIMRGLYALWLYTLKEGILDNGSASFSYFHLTWGNTATTRVDVAIHPFNNLPLLKLRRWVGFIP